VTTIDGVTLSTRAPAPPRARRVIRARHAPATVPPPLHGAWEPADTRLDHVERFPLPGGSGPEDVAVDPSGHVYTGGGNGRIWRWPADPRPGQAPALVAETGGRPLGVEVDGRDGSLVVCDAVRGLLRVAGDGAVTELCTEVAGRRLLFCNNATIAEDGTVFFTDSSDRYPLAVYKRDLLEYRPNGRLLAWHPGGSVEVVTGGLYFPNGVALTSDGSAVLLVETTTHRLVRIALATGEVSELADLPAYPDNMCAGGDGTYWIAFPSMRLKIMESLLPHPWIRTVAALLPDRLQPQPTRYGLVAQVDEAGTVLRTLHGPAGKYCMVTGLRPDAGALWLGSLTEDSVGRVPL
jgi:sugar lactone lactonase YvrE